MPELDKTSNTGVSDAWRRGLLNLLAGQGVVNLAKQYANKVVLKERPEQQKLVNKLINIIKNDGTAVDFDKNVSSPTFLTSQNKISLNNKNIAAGILAHEWGHGLVNKKLQGTIGNGLTKLWDRLYSLGASTAPIAALAAAGTSIGGASDETVRNVGLVGSSLQLPRLVDELAASIQGAKKLHQLKLPGKLGAFAGLPTYLATASLPLLPWGLRKIEPGLNAILNNQ